MDETQKKLKKNLFELQAIGVSALFLVLGFFVIWYTKKTVNIDGDAIYVSLLFFPVLVYLLVSGKIKELKGPGGLEVKLSEVAGGSIMAAFETVEPSSEDMLVVAKGGLSEFQEQQKMLNDAQPIVMTMILGIGDYYNVYAVREYLKKLSHFRKFKFVVFLDKEKRFVAYMPSWAFQGLLGMEEENFLGEQFIKVINEGRIQDLFRYPGVERKTISTGSSEAEALREMTRQNLEALVVIDENRHLNGVVEREQILSRMMIAMVDK